MKSKNKFRKVITWLLIIIGIGAVVSFRNRPVRLYGDEIEVKTGDIKTYYSFSGSIEAKNREVVFSEQAEQVREFKVEVGDIVEKDQVLYKNNRGVNIKSKISGEVLDIFVEESQQLMPGTKIMEIVDYKDLQLKVKVDEYDLKSINIGEKVYVKIHALDKEIEGIVSEIAKEGIYTNGVTFFNTIISIENDGNILVGMSAEAKIMNASVTNIAFLPMSTVKFDEENKAYVKIKKDDILENKNIELGITDGVNVEIKSGLNLGDKVFVEKTSSNFGPPAGVRQSRRSGGNN